MNPDNATTSRSAVVLCFGTFGLVTRQRVARMGRCRATSRHNGLPLYRTLPVSSRVLPTRGCHTYYVHTYHHFTRRCSAPACETAPYMHPPPLPLTHKDASMAPT